MDHTRAGELLERAAASVDPAPPDPARLVRLGRRSIWRRRGGLAAAAVGGIAATVTAVSATLPLTVPDPATSAAAAGGTSFAGLSIDLLQGWTAQEVDAFDACTAKPRTVYLAKTWQRLEKSPPPAPGSGPGTTPPEQGLRCAIPKGPWMTVVKGPRRGMVQAELVVGNGTTLEVEEQPYPGVFNYQPFMISSARAAADAEGLNRTLASLADPETRDDPMSEAAKAEFEASFVTTVHIAGDPTVREDLLEQVTWPAEPPAPASGGLALPDRILGAGTDPGKAVNPEGDSIDRPALARIRAALADLPPVPRGQECDLTKPHVYGFSLNERTRGASAGDVRIVIGDKTCPQAVSSRGGRVAVPDQLGKQIYDLLMANPR